MTYGYVTRDEVEKFLAISYPMYDDLACHFKALSEVDQNAYLLAAASKFNGLVMQGCVVDKDQEYAFPRKGCFRAGIIPQEVKDAQIEEALAIFKHDLSVRSDEQIKTMSSLGIVKNMKYNKRELGEVGLTEFGTQTKKNKLYSDEAMLLLKPWIGG